MGGLAEDPRFPPGHDAQGLPTPEEWDRRIANWAAAGEAGLPHLGKAAEGVAAIPAARPRFAAALARAVIDGTARGEFAHAAQGHALRLDREATLETFGDLPLLGHNERGLPTPVEWARRVESWSENEHGLEQLDRGAWSAAEAGPEARRGLARALGEAVAEGSVEGRFAREALEEALELDARAAVGAFTGRGGRLGAALADQGLGTRIEALDALAGGALGGGDRRGAINALLRDGMKMGDLNGEARTDERVGREEAYREALAGALATAFLEGAPAAEADAASGRVEGLLATPAGRELLARAAAELGWDEREALLDAVVTDPGIDAEMVEDNLVEVGLGDFLTSAEGWRALGEFALGSLPLVGQALALRDLAEALRDGDLGAAAAAAVGLIPGPAGEALSKMTPGALKAIGRRLDQGWKGPLRDKPEVDDPKLQSLFDEVYRDRDEFPGGTSGMLLEELGDPSSWVRREGSDSVEPRHLQKARNRLREITKRLSDVDNPLTRHDRGVAERVQRDLRYAIEAAREAIKDGAGS